jgi:hypothetical protein
MASPVEASMLSSSRDSPRTLSSILSGEGLYEMQHGRSQLAFLPYLQLTVVRDGAEAETKGEGSADLLGGSIPSRASIHRVSGNLMLTSSSPLVRRPGQSVLRPPHPIHPLSLKDADILI